MKDILDVKAELEKIVTIGESGVSAKLDILNMIQVVIAGIREEEMPVVKVHDYPFPLPRD